MTILKRVSFVLLAGIIGLCGLELGTQLAIPGIPSVISPAEAVVGRPLTLVSVAGVARRTVRRCAVGVYDCSLVLAQQDPEPVATVRVD
jgi:hypothetical protein